MPGQAPFPRSTPRPSSHPVIAEAVY